MGVKGIRDDRKFIFTILARMEVFSIVVGRVLWVNHGGGRINDLDGREDGYRSFGNIYCGSGRTKGEL